MKILNNYVHEITGYHWCGCRRNGKIRDPKFCTTRQISEKKTAVQSGRISRFGYKEKFCVLFSLSVAHTSN